MKNQFNYILLFLLGISTISCEKDNYEPPKSALTGRVVYQGTPLHLQPNRVSYELFQDGFGKSGPITGTFTAEGIYSQLLFNGTYTMIIREGQGPFLWGESVDNLNSEFLIDVNGATEMDIQVLPFWMIQNPALSFGNGMVTGTFGLEQILTGAHAKNIESVTLYISKTIFANSETNVATSSIGGGDIEDLGSVSISVNVPTLVPSQNYVFASIGVKIAGVEDMLFSEVQKVTF